MGCGLRYEFDNYMFTKDMKEEIIQTFWCFKVSYEVTTLIVTNGKGSG